MHPRFVRTAPHCFGSPPSLLLWQVWDVVDKGLAQGGKGRVPEGEDLEDVVAGLPPDHGSGKCTKVRPSRRRCAWTEIRRADVSQTNRLRIPLSTSFVFDGSRHSVALSPKIPEAFVCTIKPPPFWSGAHRFLLMPHAPPPTCLSLGPLCAPVLCPFPPCLSVNPVPFLHAAPYRHAVPYRRTVPDQRAEAGGPWRCWTRGW